MKKIINRGLVFFVKYLLIQENEIKIMNFIGLLISTKNNNKSMLIQNIIKKEKVRLTINLYSPTIYKFQIVKKYKKKFRLAKLYHKL